MRHMCMYLELGYYRVSLVLSIHVKHNAKDEIKWQQKKIIIKRNENEIIYILLMQIDEFLFKWILKF